MHDLLKELDALLVKCAFPLSTRLRPPAPAPEIEAAEEELGVRFPDEVRALYQWHDGQNYHWDRHPLFFADQAFTDLQNLLRCWRGNNENVALLPEEFASQDPETIAVDQVVRFDPWNRGWIPVGDSKCGPLLCVDLAPGPAGVFGQVIEWLPDSPDGHVVVASGLHEHLVALTTKLQKGLLKFSVERSCWIDSETGRDVSNRDCWSPID